MPFILNAPHKITHTVKMASHVKDGKEVIPNARLTWSALTPCMVTLTVDNLIWEFALDLLHPAYSEWSDAHDIIVCYEDDGSVCILFKSTHEGEADALVDVDPQDLKAFLGAVYARPSVKRGYVLPMSRQPMHGSSNGWFEKELRKVADSA